MKDILGLRAIEEWIRSRSRAGILFLSKETKRNTALAELAGKKGFRIEKISEKELAAKAGSTDHKGILLAVREDALTKDKKSTIPSYEEIHDNALILFLDCITDPRNVGAILRSADLFSADLIVVPKDRAVSGTPAVTKTSAGADAFLPVLEAVNLSREIGKCKEAGFWVFGADMAGKPVWDAGLTGKVAVVLGSEGKGIRPNVKKHCDDLIAIPQSGHIDSFNVSVAAGIILYEIRRQQAMSVREG